MILTMTEADALSVWGMWAMLLAPDVNYGGVLLSHSGTAGTEVEKGTRVCR